MRAGDGGAGARRSARISRFRPFAEWRRDRVARCTCDPLPVRPTMGAWRASRTTRCSATCRRRRSSAGRARSTGAASRASTRVPVSRRCSARPSTGAGCSLRSARLRHSTRRYRHDTLILESVYETDEGSVRAIEFMPPRGVAPDIVRIVEGLEGSVRMRSELAIRFDFGDIVPWVRRDRSCPGGRRRSRRPLPPHAARDSRRGDDDGFRVHDRGRRSEIPFVLTWFPSHEPLPREIDPEVALDETEEYWLEWASTLRPPRGLPRGDPPVAAAAESAHVCADGRDRGGPDDVVAGVDRRRAELGLPVLLAPRRDADPARDAELPATATRRWRGGNGSSAPSPAIRPMCRSCTGSAASGVSTSG